MREDRRDIISRRSLLLQASMLVPLWQIARLPNLSGKAPPAALPPAGDEFVEVNGWILRRSEIA